MLLIEIRKSDQWLFLDKCSTFLVPVLDLDAVQHGSIWDGNVLTDQSYRFSGKLITKRFSFDFTNNKPKNIKLTDRIPNTSDYYIPLKTISSQIKLIMFFKAIHLPNIPMIHIAK